MIVRSSFKCLTCERPHTVRIGVGYENRHTHRFPCSGCGEDLVIVMISGQDESYYAYPEAVENAEKVPEVAGAKFVNLHPNFVMPADQRNVDRAFPHLDQMNDMVERAQALGAGATRKFDPKRLRSRPHRCPDFDAEWQFLKKAWNLHRNGHDKLSLRKMEEASSEFHATEPLKGLDDWMWRFVMLQGRPAYEPLFAAAIKEISPLAKEDRFKEFIAFYRAEMQPVRGERYLGRMKAYFAAYSEFVQVYLTVVTGGAPAAQDVAGSADFEAVRMFYGDTFEVFTSSVDLFAYLNNLILGRRFDEFAQLTQDEYLKLDKAGRKNAFGGNAAFTAVCAEWDNQIRNASHHGSFSFDPKTQLITYRAGKGGTGPEQQLAYSQYLARSSQLFLQLMVIFRIEIILCHLTKTKMPF